MEETFHAMNPWWEGRAADTAPRAVEAKYVNTFDWQDRRFQGVRLFLRRFPACRRVTVVTRDAAGEVAAGPAKVTAIPLWRYLLRE